MRTSLITFLCLLHIQAWSEIGTTPNPAFAWEHPNRSMVGRYELHYGPVPRRTNDPIYERGYTHTNVVIRFATNATLANINPGIWFVSIMAVGTNGVASDAPIANQSAPPGSLE